MRLIPVKSIGKAFTARQMRDRIAELPHAVEMADTHQVAWGVVESVAGQVWGIGRVVTTPVVRALAKGSYGARI